MTDVTEPAVGRRESSARLFIQIGAIVAAVGIALAVSGEDELARWLTLAGVASLVAGLHRFGRLGADPPSEPPVTPDG
jgi:hypothetical protein